MYQPEENESAIHFTNADSLLRETEERCDAYSVPLPTGWETWDKAIGEMHPGRLVTVVANCRLRNPFDLYLTWFRRWLMDQRARLYVLDFQNNQEETLRRIYAPMAGESISGLRENMDLLRRKAARKFGKGGFYQHPALYLTAERCPSVQALSREIVAHSGGMPAVVAINYLQLLISTHRHSDGDHRMEIDEIARQLYRLAADHPVLVLLMAMVEDEPEINFKMVRNSCGMIEGFSDILAFLNFTSPGKDNNLWNLDVRLNRNGPQTELSLLHDPESATVKPI